MTDPTPAEVIALKACPSGHTKTTRDNNNIYGSWWVKCHDGECAWRTAGDTEAEAIAAWNARAALPQPPAADAGEVRTYREGVEDGAVRVDQSAAAWRANAKGEDATFIEVANFIAMILDQLAAAIRKLGS